MNPAQTLIARLSGKEAAIGIIGMGYVGLPLTLAFADAGLRTIGFDTDQAKVDKLNAGRSYIEHVPDKRLEVLTSTGFEATTDMGRASDADALIICVPTPLNRHREPDLRYVVATIEAIVPHLRSGQIVSLESTTYPGTTDEVLRPRIEAQGHVIGEDVFLVYSPEREDPGNGSFDTKSIPKVLGATTPACLDCGHALYGQVVDRVVGMSSTRAAEMTKLLENIHRAVNIGLVNEMKIVADRMGIDIFEVVDAAATKPFGFTPFYPGPGLGGHCIPIDPFYLTWKAREFGVHTRFIELAGEVNRSMPEYVLSKLMDGLNSHGKPVRGSKVLVLGVAYKKNVDDMRESPSVELMEMLKTKGAVVEYSDPHVPTFPPMREHRFELSSVALTPDQLAAYDAVLLATDHDAFDYDAIQRHAALIIDARGRYRSDFPNVVRS